MGMPPAAKEAVVLLVGPAAGRGAGDEVAENRDIVAGKRQHAAPAGRQATSCRKRIQAGKFVASQPGSKCGHGAGAPHMGHDGLWGGH